VKGSLSRIGQHWFQLVIKGIMLWKAYFVGSTQTLTEIWGFIIALFVAICD